MSDLTALLTDVQSRNSRTGIITADRYFRDVQNCFDGGFCPVKNVGIASAEQWQKALKDAERKLTYCGGRRPIKDSFRKSKQSDSIMEFDAIITTTRRDRDLDVLESRGVILDKHAPLLCQHMPMMLIGKYIRTVKRTDSFVKCHYGIADTELGHDYAKLARYGALRMSHGFDPKVFEPMEDERGWHFQKLEIFEHSMVSVPSNVDAVITSVSKHKWASPLVKGWAERLKPKTQVSVPTLVLELKQPESFRFETTEGEWSLPEESKACTCGKSTDDALNVDVMDAVYRTIGERFGWTPEQVDSLSLRQAQLMLTNEEIAEKQLGEFKRGQFPKVEIVKDAPEPRSLESIETEYIAALAKADIGTLGKASRQLSLMLTAAQDREDAKRIEAERQEWDSFVSL